MELPFWVQVFLIIVQVAAVVLFLWLIWPQVKNEEWKKKFIDNKQALSILIVFVLVFIFVYGMTAIFSWLYPVELVY
ncbi:hypothetical protein JX580_06735 [Thiomicrospira microaerophila]|uniref:hypothetical protein n=1 Tax=Thiomicrospira microaerophila TaxID=406020 RepID=UPI00200CC083|nr:hypothetical protein [Thiomicrospira microaerophila]UQB41389.1 hypothetical protein JX580_06735 [Thiomicrospira microaerophila]